MESTGRGGGGNGFVKASIKSQVVTPDHTGRGGGWGLEPTFETKTPQLYQSLNLQGGGDAETDIGRRGVW